MSKPPKNMLKDLIAGVNTSSSQADAAPPGSAQLEPAKAAAPSSEQPVLAAAPQLPAEAAPPPVPRRLPVRKPEGQGTLRGRAKQLSLYLEEPVYDQLREIAHVERTKMHQLIVEGIDLLLKKKGSPSIRELLRKTG